MGTWLRRRILFYGGMYRVVGVATFFLCVKLLPAVTGDNPSDVGPSVELHDEVSWNSPDCAGLPDGSYPDYESGCSTFFVCHAGRTHVFWCGNNTLFNPSKGHCDLPSRVNCIDDDDDDFRCEEEDGVYTDYDSGCRSFYFCKGGKKSQFTCPDGTRFDWRHGACRPLSLVQCEQAICGERPDGAYPDVVDGCKRFYLCRAGAVRSEHICPPGRLFDERTESCAPIRDVSCIASEGFNCEGLPNAYYTDFRHGCQNFWLCVSGSVQRYSCPGDLLFNVVPLACDYPSRASCRVPHDAECSSIKNGVVADITSSCREFVVCRDGVAVYQGVCASDHAMNPVSAKCEPFDQVTCAATKDTRCDRMPDGPHADYASGCSEYFVCLSGRTVLTAHCPDTMSFDPAVKECLPSPDVVCRSPRLSRAFLMPQYNCEGRIGIFPDFSTKCRRYVICGVGRQEALLCPEGKRYSTHSNQCEAQAKVDCQAPTIIGSFQCSPEEGGIFPENGNGCRVWHECWRQSGRTYICPSGQSFDLQKAACEDARENSCIAASGEHFAFGPELPVSKVVKTNFSCSRRPNSIYRGNGTRCNIFHICANGTAYSYSLPTNFTLSEDVGFRGRPLKGRCNDVVRVDPRCRDLSDGPHVDPSSNCRSYFQCEGGRLQVMQCPSGHLFSVSRNSCEPAGGVKCLSLPPEGRLSDRRDRNEPVVLRLPSVNQTSENTFGSFDGRGTSETPFNCPSGQPGFFADYSSRCRKFHICFLNIVKTYSCPSLLLFNSDSKNCDLPEKVRCDPAARTTHNCSSKPAGSKHVDPGSNCRRYYVCNDGRAVLYSCPHGRLFDEKTQDCDHASAVSCKEQNVDSLTRRMGSKFTGRKMDIPHAHGLPQRFLFDCSDKSDGFYPDYARNCHVFYRCIKGKKFSHYCKRGLLFNSAMDICDFEENVVCSDVSSKVQSR